MSIMEQMMKNGALLLLAGQSLVTLCTSCGDPAASALRTEGDGARWALYDSLLRYDPDRADSLLEVEYRNYTQPPTDSTDYCQLLQRRAVAAAYLGRSAQSDSLADLVHAYCAAHLACGGGDRRLPALSYLTDGATAINALYTGRLQRAVDYFEAARATAYRYGLTRYYYDIAINISDVYLNAGRLPEAAENLRRGLYLCDSLEMTSASKVPFYNALSNLYLQLGDNATALRYSDDGMSCLEGVSALDRFSFWNNRGNIYYLRAQYEEALRCFDSCARICSDEEEISDYNAYISRLNRSDAQVCLGRYEGVDARLDSCAAYFEAGGLEHCSYYLATLRARILLLRDGDPQGALALLRRSPYTTQSDYLRHLRHKLSRDCYLGIHCADSIVALDGAMLAYKDSLLNNLAAMRVADVELQYKESIREARLLAHQRSLELRIAVAVTGVLILLLIIAAVTFRYVTLRRRRDLQYQQLSNSILKERIRNLRQRLSPHYLMNLARLLDEARQRSASDRDRGPMLADEAAIALTLRRSMELSGRLAATLDEELSFVKEYLRFLPQSADLRIRYYIDPTLNPALVRLPGMSIQLPVENAVKYAYPATEAWAEQAIEVTVQRAERAHHSGIEVRVEDYGAGLGTEPARSCYTGGYTILSKTIAFLNVTNRPHLEMSLADKARHEGGAAHGTLFTLFVPDGFDFME